MGKMLLQVITVVGILTGILAAYNPIKDLLFPKKQWSTDLSNRDLLVHLFNAEMVAGTNLGKWKPADGGDYSSIIKEDTNW